MSDKLSLSNTKERIQYIDALRGTAMLMVLFAHIEIFCFFDFGYETVLTRFFSVIHMPIFFFISGLCIYKTTAEYNRSRIFKDIIRLIIPAFVVGLVYTYLKINQEVLFFLSNPMKAGYWFTISLFEILLVYYLIFNASKGRNHLFDFVLILVAVLLYLLKLPFKIIPQAEIIGNYLCLHQTCNYFLYFALGVMVAKYREKIFRLMTNRWIVTCLLFVLIISSYMVFSYLSESQVDGVLGRVIVTIGETVVGISGVLVLYVVFNHYQSFFSDSNIIGKSLILIGKNTLPIYLLHYFILPKLLWAGNFLENSPGVICELMICLPLSLLVAVVCIAISQLIRVSPLMSKMLLGDK